MRPLTAASIGCLALMLLAAAGCSHGHGDEADHGHPSHIVIPHELVCTAYEAATAAGYDLSQYVVVALHQDRDGWSLHFERKELLEQLGFPNDFGVSVDLNGKARVSHGR